jgi:methionine-rich copper-binding protein CopC/putative copper export protein
MIFGKAFVGLLRIVRLLLDARAVAERDLVDGVADSAARNARAHGQNDARPLAGADKDVLRPRWAVHEVPRAQAAFLALDQEEAFAGEDEEIFLGVFPVVLPVRLPGVQDADADSDLLEPFAGGLERRVEPTAVVLEPLRVPRVHHEPRRRHVVTLALLAAFVIPALASAHATLVRTSPADGAIVQRAPAAVRVVFDDRVLRGPGIAAIRNGGGSVLDGKAHVEDDKTLVIPLKPRLGDGAYSVRWAVVSDDGHLESGVLAFAVGEGQSPTVALGAEATGPRPPDVIARWLFFAGVLAAVGIALFALVAAADAEPIALVLATAAVLAALGAADEAHRVGLSTRAGTAFVVGSAYAVVVALVAAAATLEPRALRPALVLALGLVAVPTVAGHALDRGLNRVNVAVDILHVAGASAWVGALLGIVLVREARRSVALAAAGVVLLAATGVVRAGFELLHVSQLWSTSYGRALLWKTGLLLVALAAGWLVHARMRRRAGLELVLIAGILVAVSVLVLERPGRNVAAAVALPLPTAVSPPPTAPPRGAIVIAHELGPWGVAVATEPRRLTVLLLSPAGGGASGRDVTIEGHETTPCGQGCYRLDGTHDANVDVAVDGRETRFDLPRSATPATAEVTSITQKIRTARSVEYIEHLASDETHSVTAHWRLESPNRLSYSIRGGAAAVVIGTKRWDRDAPGKPWVESPQTPLRMPTTQWTRWTNAWQISTHHVVFVDQSIPAYFDVEFHERPTEMRMTAAAHFMTDRYLSFDSGPAIRPPR